MHDHSPLTVVMEDPIVHTVDFPVCGNPDCICYQLEREQAIADFLAERTHTTTERLVNTNGRNTDTSPSSAISKC